MRIFFLLIIFSFFIIADVYCTAAITLNNEFESSEFLDTNKVKFFSLNTLAIGYVKDNLWSVGAKLKKISEKVDVNNFMIGIDYNTDKSLTYRFGYGKMINFTNGHFLQAKLFYKKAPYFRATNFDYTLNYNKTRIDIDYLTDPVSNNKFFSSIAFVNEQQAIFTNGIVTKKRLPLYDIKLGYTSESQNDISSLAHNAVMEYGQYKDPFVTRQKFLKVTYQGKSAIAIDNKRKLHVGGNLSFMIINDHRKSQSYANELVKGTIALSGQSSSDYLYEHDYFSRKGSIDFLDNQVAYSGGMMRFSNTRGSRVGLSNDLGYVVCSSVEIVKNKFITMSPYLDFGGYSDFAGGSRSIRNIYSGGVEIKLKELLVIYLPIFQSLELKSANDFSQKGILNRIGFQFDLRKKYFNTINNLVPN